ncbi:MAG: nicotinate-nucleotide--dimethylbenzimidazole phosphoribosyltransferase [Thermodesulfobacteriota bacterium]
MNFQQLDLDKMLAAIVPADGTMGAAAQERLDNLTKPLGALGRLEEAARQLCAIQQTLTPSVAVKKIITFAGDHGVVAEGVSAVPAEVTQQMVHNFLAGGAGVNVLARQAGAEVRVVDVGVAAELSAPGLLVHKVKAGTDNLRHGPAMSEAEALAAIGVGAQVAASAMADGAQLLGTGEMGIGNTTPSAALFAAYLGLTAEEITGRGTGLDDAGLARKVKVIDEALAVNRQRVKNGPLATLAALGGLEIAAICGMILAAAGKRVAVVVDGFISSAGALAALKMQPAVADYLFFSHMSAEQGHRHFFTEMNFSPLLHLDLRLGEGTGAALAMPIIEAGVKIITEMATFAEAGVEIGEESEREES